LDLENVQKDSTQAGDGGTGQNLALAPYATTDFVDEPLSFIRSQLKCVADGLRTGAAVHAGEVTCLRRFPYHAGHQSRILAPRQPPDYA
jgi:hypothetical protein